MSDRTLIAIALDYPLALRGGVSVIVESLLKYLSPEFEILLVSPDEPEELRRHPAFTRLTGHIQFHPARLTRARAREFGDMMARRGVRLVHFHAGGNLEWGNRRGTKSPLPFLRRAGIPCVFSAHQISPLLEGYCAKESSLARKLVLLPAVWTACTYALAHASCILTDSKHDADQFKRQYPLLAGKTGFVYHSRLDANEAGAPTDAGREKLIVSVGHVAFRKGQHILAEAFSRIAAQHPDWKLVMAGPVLEPECGDQIEKICRRFPGQMFLAGSHPAPRQLMRQAAIFVQPSLMEALGLALQEAMFFGCACIGTTAGGIPELIAHDETGLLCPAGNADALAAALAGLIRQPEQRRRFGSTAPASIIQKGMTGQAMAASHEKIYRRFLHHE
ncbi:MAG: glycosyltransferase family 4 protein [Verrucomicrobia bacterium]|nr:glycosyltransferase family 4 protein [Verrucomicrobiota bacterium]